jgi:acyl-CoA reductase-like NAD-dependent aldehyde dehydrogenase
MQNTRRRDDVIPEGKAEQILPGRLLKSHSTFPASSTETIDRAVSVLQSSKKSWASSTPAQRTAILDEILPRLIALADRWVTASLQAKGTRPGTFSEAEEWGILSAVFTLIHRLHRSLRDIEKFGRPKLPRPIVRRPNGYAVARLFPQTRAEGVLFTGVTGEVWFKYGDAPDDLAQSEAQDRSANQAGGVVLVLGAGNVGAVPVVDMLNKLFVENQVVALKVNPVNAYLGPLIEEAFVPLVRLGALRILYGGASEGQYLCNHAAIDSIHLTGSDKTFNSIVFGAGARRAAKQPLLVKPISAELGCVSPVIVVPGPWADRDVREQAIQIATWLCSNAGFNCVTPRVVIQRKGWALGQHFLGAIADVLGHVKTRPAYYPGAKMIHSAYLNAYPHCMQIGETLPGDLPWTLIPDVDPHNTKDRCFRTEAFCSLLAETSLEAADVPAFLDRAVSFSNDVLWGNLSASIIIHPKSLSDPAMAAALEKATTQLRYGTIGINCFAGYAYLFMLTPWGAYPGNALSDIQSGTGHVNNVMMLRRPNKVVYRGLFRKFDPLTVVSTCAHQFGRQLAHFQAHPTFSKLPKIFWTAIRESLAQRSADKHLFKAA